MADTKNDENWITSIDSKYRLVLIAAKRSKQLQKGARPRVQSSAKKTTRVALEEIQRGLIQYTQVVKESPADS
ncbi:MAG TPA: DNA-directed RNA polymerase subunit omega [Blastocatellia bacterium]|jgi:DNA-directed RNA polymerase subunit omega|nr:DNA-directed RNA polymerase subunit omega [Blastocatellia bacterium]